MPRKIVELEYDDESLTPGESHKREGSYSFTRYDDEGNLVETATYRDIDEEELKARYREDEAYKHDDEYERRLTEEEEKLAEFLGEIIVAAVIAASPYIKRWWCETAFPGIKGAVTSVGNAIRSHLPTKSRKKDAPEDEVVVDAEIVEATELACRPQVLSDKINDSYEEYRVDMSSEEARKNLLEIVMLANLLAKRVNLLSHAEIKDDEWQKLESLITSESLIEGVNSILLEGPHMAQSDLMSGMEALLGRSLYNEEGVYQPIDPAEMRRALSEGEDDDFGDSVMSC